MLRHAGARRGAAVVVREDDAADDRRRRRRRGPRRRGRRRGGPARDARAGGGAGRDARRRPGRGRRLARRGVAPARGAAGVIRVLLADDQALVRAGFRALLDAQPDIDVVGEAADGAEAVALARRRPDVVLMDVRMPRMDGLEATRADHRRPLAGTRVIVLTTFELDEYVFGALRAGAAGFLLKDIDPPDLLGARARGRRRRGAARPAPHPAADRGVRRPGPRRDAVARRHARGAHAARARGAHARRPRALQRRDRRQARAVPADGQDPRRRLFRSSTRATARSSS